MHYHYWRIVVTFVSITSPSAKRDSSDNIIPNRCWRLSIGLLNGGEPTTYVCTSQLSKQLPLWTNSRQCAECPRPPEDYHNAATHDACDSKAFGRMDHLAGDIDHKHANVEVARRVISIVAGLIG